MVTNLYSIITGLYSNNMYPCAMRCDILAKFETLYEDSQAILNYTLVNTTI